MCFTQKTSRLVCPKGVKVHLGDFYIDHAKATMAPIGMMRLCAHDEKFRCNALRL